MPKMKTHRASAKRYKVTATGKIRRRKAGLSHINTHMTRKRKNNLSKMTDIFEGNKDLVNTCLPYKKYSR